MFSTHGLSRHYDSGCGTEIRDLWRVHHPGIHPGSLSLAIPLWVGVMSTGDSFGHCWGRNGEFCIPVSPVTRTADIHRTLAKLGLTLAGQRG